MEDGDPASGKKNMMQERRKMNFVDAKRVLSADKEMNIFIKSFGPVGKICRRVSFC